MECCFKLFYGVGAIISFADPFTDGLTCWKYFENGRILWFALNIVFVLLPSFIYLVFWLFVIPADESSTSSGKGKFCLAALCCPFLPCFSKLYVGCTTKKHVDHDLYMEVFNCLEVGIELAPKFILQFYAAMVQTRAVVTIQIVSLTVTFLSIGWCYAHITEDCRYRTCLGGMLSVAARIFSFAFFAVALGPWVVLIIVVHMGITCVIQRSHRVRMFGYAVLSWISYTPLGTDKESEEERIKWTSRTFVQPLLQVAEDLVMAVLYYVYVDSGGRSYPHRLKIMLGLIGASILGYIVLRLSRLVKCGEGEQAADINVEEQEVIQGNQKTVQKNPFVFVRK